MSFDTGNLVTITFRTNASYSDAEIKDLLPEFAEIIGETDEDSIPESVCVEFLTEKQANETAMKARRSSGFDAASVSFHGHVVFTDNEGNEVGVRSFESQESAE